MVDHFKELPFYNKNIEKPKIKRVKNIDLHSELPIYEELNVVKTDRAFKEYEMSYKLELVEKKYPIKQLEVVKLSIKGLFNDLLNKTKCFRYQITLKVNSKKLKIEFTPVYFNSTNKTVIYHKFSIDKCFEEILYRIDNWIKTVSG